MKKQSFTLFLIFLTSFGTSNFALASERSFDEVRQEIYRDPLTELPSYSRFSIASALKSVLKFKTALMERAGLTVRDPSDFISPPAPKVLHPMGVCAEATWKIDTNSGATGLLKKGTAIPAIVRLSIASDQTTFKLDTARVTGIAVKLFPSMDPSKPVTSRNFLTADQTGLDGTKRASFLFSETSDEKIYFSNAAGGTGFAAKLGFILFDRIDGPSNFRPIYPVVDVNADGSSVEQPVGPTELRLVPRVKRRIDPLPADFRDELRSYAAGEIVFDVVMPAQAGLANDLKVGEMILGAPVISVACDQTLHFHHHPMNRSLNLSQTSARDLQLDQTERPEAYRFKNSKTKALVTDGWEHKSSTFKANLLFHEVKYFNFASDTISGSMTYMVMSPATGKELVLSAHFFENGKLSIVRRNYKLSCVTASAENIDADLCGEGSIRKVGPGRIRVVQSEGPLKWDLTFSAEPGEQTWDISEVEFEKTMPMRLEKLIPSFQGWFHWVPNFRSANVSGEIRIDGQAPVRILVHSNTGYHDQHWGIWNPSVQPMRWMHFTGVDSSNSRISVTLGEFPKNQDNRAGLTVYRNGKRMYWPPESYQVEILETGFVPVSKILERDQMAFLRTATDPKLESGSHAVAKGIKITTKQGPKLELFMTMDEAAAIQGAGKSKFVLNEEIGDVKVKLEISRTESISAKGRGFYMETSATR